eukprot:GAFH01003580.1.p1 GENE.GAFH01003580.1~~GAFH01003580.1.p1  ORF type:complete len:302 (-),score=5.57 GAFH01003580.1:14-835(-)
MLCRFLRARNCDIAATVHMLQEYLKWREETKPNSIDPTTVRISVLSCQALFGGTIRGFPVAIVNPARYFPAACPPHIAVQYVTWIFERIAARAAHLGKDRWIVVINLAGMGYQNFSLPFIKNAAHILQNYYPERLEQAYIVNAPIFFRGMYALVRPFLHPNTQAKVLFTSASQILPEAIPEYLGGTLKAYPKPGDTFERILEFYGINPPQDAPALSVIQNSPPPPAVPTETESTTSIPGGEVAIDDSSVCAPPDMSPTELDAFNEELKAAAVK